MQKMKIGILTFPINNNYGNLLQAYTLMTVLKRMGHEPWLLDIQIRNERSVVKTHLAFFNRCLKKYILRRQVYTTIPRKENRNKEFSNIIAGLYLHPFVDKYLCPKISPIYSSEELFMLVDNVAFDAFIAGSDQIWRPRMMRDFLKATYFDFLTGRKEKKITYAASFGTDEWEYSPRLTKECSELVKEIDAISVREESGVVLCKNYLSVDAQWVLDPTMLLNKEDYIKLFETSQRKQSKGDLFCYILDKTSEKQEIISSISKQLLVTPFIIGLKTEEENTEDRIFESVETWLRGFYDAKFVITDSFHGMVFSIIFNKPFLCFVNVQRGIARFTSLARQFGLENRLIYENQDFFVEKMYDEIDWVFIQKQMQIKKEASFQYLISNLV
jgi:hypothetical protein